MNTVNEFDLLHSSIEGKNLIEASAGTGKTFAITLIFLRLILERKLTVNQILVVTFTEAATNELKKRIREVLLEGKKAMLTGESEIEFVAQCVQKYRGSQAALSQLNNAIRDFDEAAIFTIHGFCSRVLQEHAFETHGLFDTELVTEQLDLLKPIVEDFWRKRLYRESKLFVSYALDRMSPDSLFDLLVDKVGLLYLQVIPKGEYGDAGVWETKFEESFRQLRDIWTSARREIAGFLNENPGLNRKQYKKTKVSFWLKAMDVYTSSADATPVLFPGFEKFTQSAVTKGMKKGCAAPEHPFLQACEIHQQNVDELAVIYQRRILALKTELFEYARIELKKRKEEKNVFFFDDLLLNVHAALMSEEDGLAHRIRCQFTAALIDEFQDTDPVQYEIFKKIFDHQESALFLIGDPKQAIYGFRGADIFAYMRAKGDIPNRYTLSTNFRSEPKLVSSLNAIFQTLDHHPFVYEEIPFQPASAADKERDCLNIEGESGKALCLWYVDASRNNESGRALRKQDARVLITKAVASEVARLLSLAHAGKAKLDERPLAERDIAVLVRTNSEAQLMQEALAVVNVHSVVTSSESLFLSDEAREVEIVLAAVAEPKRERLLLAALATEMIGVDGVRLLQLVEDEAGLEKWQFKLSRYHQTWREHGFMRFFQEMLDQEKLLTRLMSYPDGERRLTNLLHLAEVLNQAEVENRLGVTGLLKWFSEHMSRFDPKNPEHQLRLESDENAVKIATMHMSKGLEFPVVFCPFTWSGSALRRAETLTFHDENHQRRYTLDLGSEDFESHKVFAEKEALAENVRLLYVALTRAKNRCYLVWGRFSDGASSAPAYLFHPPGMLASDDVVTSLRNYVKSLDDAALRKNLHDLVETSNGSIELTDIPVPQGDVVAKKRARREELSCREFTTHIDTSVRISSYSGLISSHPHGAEIADYDVFAAALEKEETKPVAEAETTSTMLLFARGAKTGRFVHTIFQDLDFTRCSQEDLSGFIRSKLQEYGYDSAWSQAMIDMVRNVLSVPIGFEKRRFTLSQITNGARLNELEFYFPLKKLSPKIVRELFSKDSADERLKEFGEKLHELNFSELRGFMKGFIDLVFQVDDRYYIVDWKSNYLGGDVADYDQKNMSQAMVDNLYILQYYIYTLALHRYLKVRMPGYDYDRHFGGVFYVFVRGVDPAEAGEYGVFKARPSKEKIEELSRVLIEIVNR
ncbi:MAG: exodeoxyribonuclease V subunit beta [bacterium]